MLGKMSPTKRRKTEQDETKATEENYSSDKPSTSKDWRLKDLKERHQHALKQGHLTDVTFSVGPEKTLFHAHKMVLSLATPVFEAMFHGPSREVGELIEITDIVPIGFKLLLDYIYTDDLKFNNKNEAFATWIAANKYCLPVVEDLCYKYLSQCIVHHANVWTVLEHSLLVNSSPLVIRCYSYLMTNMHMAIDSPGFMDIKSETLKNILLIPFVSINEITLLRSVATWAQNRILSGSEKTLAELLKPFMEYIRFGSISHLEFIKFIGEYPDVISDSDALKILKYMTDNRKYSLPEWCSNNVNSRKSLELDRENISTIPGSYIPVYKPHNRNPKEYSDKELYQDYYNSDNEDISIDSDLSTSYFCSTPLSGSESIEEFFSDDDISLRSVPYSLTSSSD